MHDQTVSRRLPQWALCLLLVTFVFRALIPQGFMPAAGQPFALQICPDGFPTQLLPGGAAHVGHHGQDLAAASDQAHSSNGQDSHAGHQGSADPLAHAADSSSDAPQSAPAHQHRAASGEHCLFGAASAVGPASHLPIIAQAVAADDVVLPAAAVPIQHSRSHRLQQPRAPPVFS